MSWSLCCHSHDCAYAFFSMLEILVRLFKFCNFCRQLCIGIIKPTRHILTCGLCCMDCAACCSLWRPFSESRPSHTYVTPWCYGCCVHSHAVCIGCSALHPHGASSGFNLLKATSFSWRNLLPLHSFESLCIPCQSRRPFWCAQVLLATCKHFGVQ